MWNELQLISDLLQIHNMMCHIDVGGMGGGGPIPDENRNYKVKFNNTDSYIDIISW